MNAIYLITNGTGFYKVGFTTDLYRRMNEYARYNPSTTLISVCHTTKKTKMTLEATIHREIRSYGISFERDLTDRETEWFQPSNTHMATELELIGLEYFQACKGRKVMVM